MKKRGLYILIMIVSMILFVGCKGNVDNEPVDDNKVKEEIVDKVEPEIVPPVEVDKVEKEEEIEKQIGITDKAVISGMAEDILTNMTLEEKVGQLFIVNLELLDNSNGSYYEFRERTDKMTEMLEKYPIGGVCLFARNIETRDQTTKLISDLQTDSKIPLFISVDEEGGEVARIGNNDNMQTTKFPTMEEVGSYNDKEYAYNLGSTIGGEIRELGFNVNFAPVADVRTNELNTEIGNRSFGSDPKIVANMVREIVKGLQDQGISSTLKHFPGHGDALNDSHQGAVNVDNDIERLRKVDFVPFKAGIKAGADMIMVSHISISRVTEDTTPACLSSLVLNEMLRMELGFEGIIVTDAMNMKAITDNYTAKQSGKQSFIAGSDMILMPDNLVDAYESILEAVENGTIKEERLDESVRRILEVKVKRGIIPEDTDLIPTIIME